MFLSLQVSPFPLDIVPFLLFILTLFALRWLFSFSSKTTKRQPPSPPRLPVIGNFHQIGSLPHRSLQALAQKYGPVMLLRLGKVPMLVASSAEAAREILKTQDVVFSNRAKLTTPSILSYNNQDVAFAPYGDHWRQAKSIAVSQFLTHGRVKSYRHIREEEMALMIKAVGESHGSSVVNLSELFLSLANGVLCRVALGKKYGGNKYKDMLGELVEVMGVFCFGDYVPWLSWVDRINGVIGRTKNIAKEYDEFLEGVIEEHLNKKNDQLNQDQDLVDILLKVHLENKSDFSLKRDAIKAIISDMFVAGSQSTFTALEWAVSELLRSPEAMRKLQQEVEEVAQGKPLITEDDLERMQYLKAVYKESLRLHAPVPLLVPRELTEDTKVMGYDVKAGTQVLVNVWAIGRDPSLWEDAEEFKPERFLNSSIDYKGVHFEFLPFGAGRRGCPGSHFGVAVGQIALANLVHKFDLAIPGAGSEAGDLDMTEAAGMSVHKKSALLVMATPRSQ